VRATFFRSFKNSSWQATKGARRPPALYFLCDCPAVSMASVKPLAEVQPVATYSYREWIPEHKPPPWRADPILSWFSFQSSESEFSHGVSVGFQEKCT